MNWSPPYRLFALLCLLSLVLQWRTLIAAFGLALRNDAYTHILLILLISISLIVSEWRSRKAQAEPNVRAGLAPLVLAVLIGLINGGWCGSAGIPADMQLSVGMLAVVTWWIGAFVCCFGTHMFRVFAFPLCFLLWLVPLPEFAVNQIVSLLQQGSADAANWLFVTARVPVTRNGLQMTIPGLTLEVATECSSIRSSLLLLVTSMALARLLLRSAWGKGLVIFAAIPLSILRTAFESSPWRCSQFTLIQASCMAGYITREGSCSF